MNRLLCLLFCLAAAYWVSIAIAAPHTPRPPRPTHHRNVNLDSIIEIINKYKAQAKEEMDMDSAKKFTEGTGRCGDNFFCHVQVTLHKHSNRTERLVPKLTGNLDNFITHKNMNCSEVIKTPLNSTEVTLSAFLSDLKKCIQCRNLNLTSTSC